MTPLHCVLWKAVGACCAHHLEPQEVVAEVAALLQLGVVVVEAHRELEEVHSAVRCYFPLVKIPNSDH
jgi:hypothetical protein